MADRVGALDIDDREIGALAGDRIAAELVVDAGIDQDAAQRAHRLRVRVVGLGEPPVGGGVEPRQVLLQRRLVDGLTGVLERRARPAIAIGGIHDAGGRGVFLEQECEQAIGDDRAVDRLRGIRRPQPQHGDALAGRRGHVPDRRRAPEAAGDRFFDAGRRIELHEVQDPVIERADAGHHRGPDQRRERRTDRLEDAAGAFAHQPREVRHRAIRDVVVEQLPVGAVEADEDDWAPGGGGRRGAIGRRRSAREREPDDGRKEKKEGPRHR